MPSNAEKRTMDELADEAFELLLTRGPMRCGFLGSLLFPNATGAVNCSCPYARLAGKVVRRLEKQGRAFEGRNGWQADG